jgi:hypothetical protein
MLERTPSTKARAATTAAQPATRNGIRCRPSDASTHKAARSMAGPANSHNTPIPAKAVPMELHWRRTRYPAPEISYPRNAITRETPTAVAMRLAFFDEDSVCSPIGRSPRWFTMICIFTRTNGKCKRLAPEPKQRSAQLHCPDRLGDPPALPGRQQEFDKSGSLSGRISSVFVDSV